MKIVANITADCDSIRTLKIKLHSENFDIAANPL